MHFTDNDTSRKSKFSQWTICLKFLLRWPKCLILCLTSIKAEQIDHAQPTAVLFVANSEPNLIKNELGIHLWLVLGCFGSHHELSDTRHGV